MNEERPIYQQVHHKGASKFISGLTEYMGRLHMVAIEATVGEPHRATGSVLATLIASVLASQKVAPEQWDRLRYALLADTPPDALAEQAKQWAEALAECFGPLEEEPGEPV